MAVKINCSQNPGLNSLSSNIALDIFCNISPLLSIASFSWEQTGLTSLCFIPMSYRKFSYLLPTNKVPSPVWTCASFLLKLFFTNVTHCLNSSNISRLRLSSCTEQLTSLKLMGMPGHLGLHAQGSLRPPAIIP